MAKQNKGTAKKQHPITADMQSVIDEVVATTEIPVEEGTDTLDEEGHKKTAGRPVDPNSPRQKKLIEQTVKKLLGLGGRGRPVEPNSERQVRLAEMEARKEANGGVLKPGRPAMTETEKKKAEAQRKQRQEAAAKIIAEEAKKKLIKAGLMNADGTLVADVQVTK